MNGIGSHHKHTGMSHVWLTPPHILKALGHFDLDPCAAPAPRPWDTARQHYDITEGQDGLALPWFGRAWCNVPYDQGVIGNWLARLGDHGRGTALIFARTETENFHRYIWQRAEAALFLEGRLFFHHPDGRRAKHNGGAPSVLVAYGEQDADILHGCGLPGHFVPIAPTACLFVFAHHAPQAVGSWRETLSDVMREIGGAVTLAELYERFEGHPKAAGNENWRAKIRQTLARMGAAQIAPATYSMVTP